MIPHASPPSIPPQSSSSTLTLDNFWYSIDKAWSSVIISGARDRLLSGGTHHEMHWAITYIRTTDLHRMLNHLDAALNTYTSAQLCAWDAHCERALFDLDTPDVHQNLGGDAESFVWTRAFVVAMGRQFYDQFKANPWAWWVMNPAEPRCEEIAYLAAEIHLERFRTYPPKTGISRESFQEVNGWPPHDAEKVSHSEKRSVLTLSVARWDICLPTWR